MAIENNLYLLHDDKDFSNIARIEKTLYEYYKTNLSPVKQDSDFMITFALFFDLFVQV